jgi:hypothetical protein
MAKDKDRDDRDPSVRSRYDAFQALQKVFDALRAQPATKDGIRLFPRGIDRLRAKLSIDGVVALELELSGPPAKEPSGIRTHSTIGCPPDAPMVPYLIGMAVWQARALLEFAGEWTLTDCDRRPIDSAYDAWHVIGLCPWSPEPNSCYPTGGDIGVELEAPSN